MGGFIRVESEVCQGIRFIVTVAAGVVSVRELPARIGNKLDVVGLEPGQPEWRILIVEDTPENVQLLETLLSGVGLATRVAFNGLEAVGLVKSWQPHFIWMDIRMPVMDGYEATRLIRQLPGGEAIRIVALTASVFKEQEQTILDSGCNAVLHKPFRQQELFRVLEQQLGICFRYEAPVSLPPKSQLHAPTAGQLAAVPADCCRRLLQAATELDKAAVLQIAADLQADDPDLSCWLEQQVQQYDFEAIGNVLLQQRQAFP
jgi:CheY-like chemotaxis protein